MGKKSKTKPLHKTVQDSLSEKIKNGTYPVGEYLPTEVELCAIYDVSRITIRRALQELENNSLIKRTPKVGTIVTSNKIRSKPDNTTLVHGKTTLVKEVGKEIFTSNLDLHIIFADEDLSHKLAVPINTKLIQLNRVRSSDNGIVAYSKSFFPYTDKISSNPEDYYSSLHNYFRSLGYTINHTKESIEAILPNEEVAKQLKVGWYDPVLKRVKVSADSKSRFRELSIIYYNAKKYSFEVELFDES